MPGRLRALFTAFALVSLAVNCPGLALAGEAAANWLDVPFVRQQKNGCGAACVSMVIGYWSNHDPAVSSDAADPEKIQRALYSGKAKGIFALEIERFFRQEGFRTFAFKGEWIDLVQHLSKGRPLIVCLGKPRHYVVVTGLDRERDLLSVNDPARRKLLQLDRAGFEGAWSAAGRWTLLALPARNE